jgi:AAA domain
VNAELKPTEPEAAAEPGSFADRVAGRRVNLFQRLLAGIPPVDYLPGSAEILRRGKRHHMVAPKKVGKSLGALVLTVDIALAGGTVVILDRENGADLYADRLGQILAGRGVDELEQMVISGRIVYYEFPRFRDSDQAELAALCATADLAVFDSQRMYLSDLGLEENSSDDYAAFMAALVDPLFRAGIATLILDNSGHQEPKRGRGASAKGDLNEILFAAEAVEHFDLNTTGRLRLEITDSRFGDNGRWELEIGGGTFGNWQRVDDSEASGTHRPTVLMERASTAAAIAGEKLTRTELATRFNGKRPYKFLAINILVADGYLADDGHHVSHIRPFVAAKEPFAAAEDQFPEPVPPVPPGSQASSRNGSLGGSHGSPPLEGGNRGTGEDDEQLNAFLKDPE